MELRWYQTEAVESAWASIRKNQHPCIVLPTGAGKSLVIAELARQAVEKWHGRVIVLAHRKELLVQNADKLARLLPGLNIGIYSAGLNRREWWHDVVCAGIQSCYNKADQFELRHLIIVDECHLIPHSEDGMYRKFLADMETMNPQVKVVGLTATPFRMDTGTITDGGVLTDICYEASVSKLMREGWLSRVVNSATKQVDMSQVKTSRGEFVQQQMEEAFLHEVDANVTSALLCSNGRQSLLWFCSGVAHCNRTAAAIEARTGEQVGVVTGETLPIERQALLHAFASRQLRHLVNCDVLTTGFDAPCIDSIVVLRATKSAGLFAQICGRGFRLHEGKEDCLILDFGGNINRHGPLDDADYGRRRRVVREGSEEQGEIVGPQKLCSRCEESIPASCVFCPECGHFMPRENKLQQEADTQSAILKEAAKPESVYVESVMMSRHRNKDARKPDTLRIEYSVQFDGGGNLSTMVVCEWICLGHEGFALRKAMQWWQEYSLSEFPQDDIDEAISLWRRGALRTPVRLTIIKDGHWWRVVTREFEDDRPESWSDEVIDIEQDAEMEF